MLDASHRGCGPTSATASTALLHTSHTRDGACLFTLTSAEGVAYTFHLTPHMCAHSLYLQSASDVEATAGYVPVGTAQAVRDFVTYLQYMELRGRLTAEVARTTHRASTMQVPPFLSSTTATAAHASSRSQPPPPQLRQQASGLSGVWRSPFLWEERLLGGGSVFDSVEGDVEFATDQDTAGPIGYEVRHLDCDRTYAEHPEEGRHWLTAAELASLRGEAPPADVDGEGERGEVEQDALSAVNVSRITQSLHDRNEALGGGFDAGAASLLAANGEASRHGHGRLPLRSVSSSSSRSRLSSSSASPSTVSSPSEASLAAFRAEREGHAQQDTGLSSLRREPGYGAQLALEARDDIFFLERVLLPHAWRGSDERGVVAHTADDASNNVKESETSTSGREASGVTAQASSPRGNAQVSPPASSSPASVIPLPPPRVLLSARQQRRLLELISVADFMGTQSLVELCANYLAAWLMDCTDEDIVQSFVSEPASDTAAAHTSARASDFVPRYQLSGATSFQEPWLRLSTPVDRASASASPGSTATEPASRPMPANAPAVSANAAIQITTTKKITTGAAAGAQSRKKAGKGRRGNAKEPPAGTEEDRGLQDVPPSLLSDAEAGRNGGTRQGMLSGDQRLSVLRQMKRKGSIVVSPY